MKKVFSVILSLIILITSMGFITSSHICGGKKVETKVGLIAADVSCGMEKEENNCASSSREKMKSNCCQDEFQRIQMNEDYSQQLTKVNFSSDFSTVFIAVFFELFPSISFQSIFFKDYSPPPLVRDIPILVQSFLI